MGQVWQATDTQLNRQVALKILPDAFADDPDRLARFQREAQILASLNHPNIAAIHGIEEAEGTRALVLELVEGPTLADRIAKGAIPVDEALPIAKQIAEALEAAHEAGVIHRDLKPANIKVREDGTVKVLDFGLAKALDPNPEGDPSQSPTLTAAATQMGVIMGTAAYMSPEQARGKPVDKRADIWGFGCVLFEMLTGRRVFQGEDVSTTLANVIRADVSWESLPRDLAPGLAIYLRRCLDKDPTRRVRDMGDVRLAMDGAFETTVTMPSEPTVTTTLQFWQRPLPATVAALGLVILTGLGVWSATRPVDPPAESVRHFALDIGEASPIGIVNLHAMPAWSPDGTRLVYAANVDGTHQLYLRSLDDLEARPIDGTEGAYSPFFSPDGESVGVFTTSAASGELKRVALRGGTPLALCECFPPLGATWLADGTIITANAPDVRATVALYRVPEAGGTPEPLATLDTENGEVAHTWPHALPGGTAVLFTIDDRASGAADNVADRRQVAVLSLDTGEHEIVIEAGYNARYVATGHLVFGRQGALWGVPFDPERLVTTGPEELLLQGVEINDNLGAMALSVSNDGTLVYVSGAATGIEATVWALVWSNRDGADEPLPLPPRRFSDPRVSPEGSRVAVTVFDPDGGGRDIWIYDLTSGAGLRMTREGDNSLPRWTSDGEHVVFSWNAGGRRNLYRVRADGSSAAERLTTSEQDQGLISLSPDGQTAIFTDTDVAADATSWHIMSVRLDGGAEPQPVVTGPFRQGSGELSPDGRWLAYRSDEAGQFEIYVQPYPGPGPKTPISIGGGNWPSWAPDGQAVFYESEGSLMRRTFDTEPTVQLGSPEVVLDLRGYVLGREGLRRQFDVAADGERFLLRKAPVAASSLDQTVTARLTVVTGWTHELLERVPVP